MPKRAENELERIDRQLGEIERPLKRAQNAAVKRTVVLANSLKNTIASLNRRYGSVKRLAIDLMKSLNLRLVDLKQLNLRAELRFSFRLKDDEKGAAAFERLKSCFGKQAEGWVKVDEVTIARYTLTEAAERFIKTAEVDELFDFLDCISAPGEDRLPAFYVGPIPRAGRRTEGGEGE